MFLGFGLRIIVQAGYFILIARTLGVSEYGAFVGAASLAGILSPFSSLGAGNLLVKNVARDTSQFAIYWGNALLLTLLSGSLVLAILMAVSRYVLPGSIPWSLIILVGVADIFAMRIVDIAGQAFLSVDRLRYTAKLNLLPNVLRLAGAVVLLMFWHRASAATWARIYLVSSSVSALIAVLVTNWKLGTPRLAVGRIGKELREGIYFSISLSAQTIYNDIDKAMLVRLSTLDAAGIYAAAYRLIDVAFSPVRSVLYASYPNFFRHGQGGIDRSYTYARRLLRPMAGYSALVFIGLLVAAPIVPVIIGGEYLRTVEALRWLAPLPLLKTVQYFLADSLTGAGYQGFRTVCQMMVAVVNVLLNVWLIPAWSWRGAAWSSLATDALLAVVLYLGIRNLQHRARPGSRETDLLTGLSPVPIRLSK